jgi:N-acetylmuramoyl-L-alanine amidase
LHFPNLRQVQSHHSGRWVPLLLLYILAASLAPGEDPEAEKRLRELFLKSRQQMEIVPSPTPTPKETPIPATPTHKRFHPAEPDELPKTPANPPHTPRPRSTTPVGAAPVEVPETPNPITPSPTSTPETEATKSPTPEETRPVVSAPSPTPKKRHGWFLFGKRDDDEIVVQKSGEDSELAPVGEHHGRWRYLTPAVRKAIDDAHVARNRWKYIVVHNSGTRQGNARIFDYYHRHVRKMPNGLAYHFVIGNGTSTGNGQIEIGNRWVKQLAGGHVHSDYLNYIGIGICLVGDFNRDLPTHAQYEALDELIRYLRQRVGKVDGRYSFVLGHKEINPRPTDCPGNRFPLHWLHRTFPN